MRRGSEMTSEPTRHANTVPTRGAESSDPWLVDDSNSPYMKGRVWVWRSATGGEHSNPNGPGLIVPDRFDLAAGLEPDALHTSDEEPEAAEPARRVNPILLAWRYDRLWLMLSVVAGFVTGGAFLLGSFAVRGVVHPVVENVFFIGGIALLIWPPAWIVVDTWLQSRRLSKLQSQPEFSTE